MTGTASNVKQIKQVLKASEKVFLELHPLLPRESQTMNLTMAQFKVLTLLFQRGPSRMPEIADALGVFPITVNGIVDRMELGHLVLREKPPEDRRIVFCRLTRQGENLMDTYMELFRSRMGDFLKSLEPEQVQLVGEVAEKFLGGRGIQEKRQKGRRGRPKRKV